MTFDRVFARLLLEICRFTYAAGFNDVNNVPDKQDALDWINKIGGHTTDESIILRGSSTPVACIASYPDRNIVAYMGTKTQSILLPTSERLSMIGVKMLGFFRYP